MTNVPDEVHAPDANYAHCSSAHYVFEPGSCQWMNKTPSRTDLPASPTTERGTTTVKQFDGEQASAETRKVRANNNGRVEEARDDIARLKITIGHHGRVQWFRRLARRQSKNVFQVANANEQMRPPKVRGESNYSRSTASALERCGEKLSKGGDPVKGTPRSNEARVRDGTSEPLMRGGLK